MPHPTSPVPGAGQAVSSALVESIVTLSGLDSTGLSSALRTLIEGQGLTQEARLFRLELGAEPSPLDEVLLIHQADITEQVCEDESLRMRLLCLSTRANLPARAFLGQPARVRVVTDRGGLRDFCGIVRRAVPGPSNGGEQAWLIEAVDGLTLLDRGCDERVFLHGSVLDIVQAMHTLWQQRSPALAHMDLDLSLLQRHCYPVREFSMQAGESDARYFTRLLRNAALGWTILPGTCRDPEARGHTLRLFDELTPVPANPAGTTRYHLDGAAQARDAITEWMSSHELIPSAVTVQSWDYKLQRNQVADAPSAADLGEQGARAAAALSDHQLLPPHWSDDREDLQRLARLRMRHHELATHTVHGGSGVRDAACFTRLAVTGLPGDERSPTGREIVFTQVRHFGRNNFGPEIDARLQDLFERAGWLADWPVVGSDPASRRYGNTFKAVPHLTPIVPHFDARLHWPRLFPRSAIVVGPPGEEVHCDELGRHWVAFPGVAVHDLRRGRPDAEAPPASFPTPAHTQQMGSAPLRQVDPHASAGFGQHTPLHVGDEVLVTFLGGSPEKPLILGGMHSPHKPHPRLGGRTAMPGNRYLAGWRGKEVASQRASELLIDSTPGQTRVQLSSDHANSHIQVGFVVHPRTDGRAEPRGDGVAISSDANVSMNAGQGVYVVAGAEGGANGAMLERQGLLGLAQALQGIVEELAGLSDTHRAGEIDPKRLAQLVQYLQDWHKGSNTAPQETGGGAPIVAISSQASAGMVSQDNLLLGAQTNVDAVSAGHVQVAAGQQIRQRAMAGISQFSHAGGIQTIAGQGAVDVQAQQGCVNITASDTIALTAGKTILIQAPQVIVVGNGAQTSWSDGGIVEQASGAFEVHSAGFKQISGGGGSPQGVSLFASSLATDERGRATRSGSGEPLPGRRYTAYSLVDGSLLGSGITDEQGYTQAFQGHSIDTVRIVVHPEEPGEGTQA